MKLSALFLLLSFILFGFLENNPTESLEGAWKLVAVDGQPLPGDSPSMVRIMSGSYTMLGVYQSESPEFEYADGGSYTFDGTTFSSTVDFSSDDSSLVGLTLSARVELKGDTSFVTFPGTGDPSRQTWVRLDAAGTPLSGHWKIRAREREGVMADIQQTGPRKTIKILSGTRFQWCAMNTETKEFLGTGGGSYTFEDGEYKENIEFFSRDNSRVGASLSFQGWVEGNDWHHKGLSSRGEPIYEIWARQ